MDQQSKPPAEKLFQAFERPAQTLMVAWQMLLGLGLAVTLFIKIYFIVLGNQVCTVGDTTLGNLIRCTDTLGLLAQFLILTAAIRFAALLFTATPFLLLEPLLLALTGVMLQILSGQDLRGADWMMVLFLLVLFCGIGCIFAGLHFWRTSRPHQ